MILSLSTANTAGHTKKVITNAVLFLGYCTGNIAGPFFYKTDQAPTYRMGIASMIASHLIEFAIVIVFRIYLASLNRARDKEQGEEEREAHLDETAFGDLTDKENRNFRYVY